MTSRGTTFVELMVAICIVGVALMVMVTQITISFRETSMNEDRVFAYRKAMALLAEVQNGIERGDIPDAESLDLLADREGRNFVLTTLSDPDGNAFEPHHPMSGNVLRRGEWRWSRVIEVETPPHMPKLRYVRIKVCLRRDDGQWGVEATIGSIVALKARAFQAQKYYDVYVLAISEAPSLWLPMAPARALLESSRIELQTIDNGLKMRFHWITKLGYGRDPMYVPCVNATVPASDATPGVYWYPGKLAAQGGEDLYSSEFFSGRIRTEKGVQNDYDADTNPWPHAVADQFNHCMRSPEARALFDRRVEAGLEKPDEPPLQILLEDMARDPERFRNAIFVNLHGSALPMPPLRNYSDAAKDPLRRPGVRVVTHPETLWTRRDIMSSDDSDNAFFRVYAYQTEPSILPTPLLEPITLQIMDVNLTEGVNGGADDSLQILSLDGGVYDLPSWYENKERGSGGPAKEREPKLKPYSAFTKAPRRSEAKGAFKMSYEVGYVDEPGERYTWIKLYNTPLGAPPVNEKGLAPAERLYGMEYVPGPVTADGFSDLATTGLDVPKNTARWRIGLPKILFDVGYGGGFGANADQLVTVVTRIGDDLTTGQAWPVPHEPHNISKTYTWWTSSPLAVPVTERYQFQGDPRHNPYRDLTVSGSSFPNGYNWHFDDLRGSLVDATPKWPCLDPQRLQDGFGAGCVADVPRLLQLLRGSLQQCGGIFVNPTGVVAHALVLGGEIGMPGQDVAVKPVLLHGDIAGAAEPVNVDTISPALPSSETVAGKPVVVGNGASRFWAMDWLGEPCPDSAYAEYLATGNLTAGGDRGFHRSPRSEAVLAGLPAGTDFNFEAGQSLGLVGSIALVDSGTLDDTFFHVQEFETPESRVTSFGQEIGEATGDSLPETMPSTWPFATNQAFAGQLPYFGFTADYPKSTVKLLEQDYNGVGALTSAGVLAVTAPSSDSTAFLTILGLSPTDAIQHEQVAMTALMLGLRSFHRAGEPAVTGRVTQVPRVEIIEPVEGATLIDPGSVLLRWKTSFYRFDQKDYTKAYPPGFSEPEQDLVYSVLYSRDDGETWFYALDSQPAVAGERPPESLLLSDLNQGVESLQLPTPEASYVGSEYVFRVECYHKTRRSHFSVHQIRALLTR